MAYGNIPLEKRILSSMLSPTTVSPVLFLEVQNPQAHIFHPISTAQVKLASNSQYVPHFSQHFLDNSQISQVFPMVFPCFLQLFHVFSTFFPRFCHVFPPGKPGFSQRQWRAGTSDLGAGASAPPSASKSSDWALPARC